MLKILKLGFSSEPRTSRCTSWVLNRQRNQRSNCQHSIYNKESKRIPEKKTSTSASLIMLKPLTMWITTNRKILKGMGIPDHLTCLLRNLYAGQEATACEICGTWNIGRIVPKEMNVKFLDLKFATSRTLWIIKVSKSAWFRKSLAYSLHTSQPCRGRGAYITQWTRHEITDCFQIRKGVHKAVYCHTAYLTLCRVYHAKCWAGWITKLKSRLPGEIPTSDMRTITTIMERSEKELARLWIRTK